jgi:hypothetical protein
MASVMEGLKGEGNQMGGAISRDGVEAAHLRLVRYVALGQRGDDGCAVLAGGGRESLWASVGPKGRVGLLFFSE